MADNSELWVREDAVEGYPEVEHEDAAHFSLELCDVGQQGGFHVRGKPGEKQRQTVSSFGGGTKKRPAFRVGCSAKAIIHGTLDESGAPASLLIYDFSFFSYRSTRIKEADISFEFRNGGSGRAGSGPTVQTIAPYGRHVMMPSTQSRSVTVGAEAGPQFAGVSAALTASRTVEKTTDHAAEITGDRPSDDWGGHYLAQWSLKENDSQKNGIVSLLRTCILLTRENNEDFLMMPVIEARPDTKTWVGSLFSTRTPDDPIEFDPSMEPFNQLGVPIDRRKLGEIDVDRLWDCTFHSTFEEAVKISRAPGSALSPRLPLP